MRRESERRSPQAGCRAVKKSTPACLRWQVSAILWTKLGSSEALEQEPHSRMEGAVGRGNVEFTATWATTRFLLSRDVQIIFMPVRRFPPRFKKRGEDFEKAKEVGGMENLAF